MLTDISLQEIREDINLLCEKYPFLAESKYVRNVRKNLNEAERKYKMEKAIDSAIANKNYLSARCFIGAAEEDLGSSPMFVRLRAKLETLESLK